MAFFDILLDKGKSIFARKFTKLEKLNGKLCYFAKVPFIIDNIT